MVWPPAGMSAASVPPYLSWTPGGGDVGLGAQLRGTAGMGAEGLAGAGGAGEAAGAGALGEMGGLLGSGMSAGQLGMAGIGSYLGGQAVRAGANALGAPSEVSGGLGGAAMGAGIGSMVFPGVGTLVGAGLGGLLGATGIGKHIPLIGSLFGGDDKPAAAATAFNEPNINLTIRKLAAQLSPSDLRGVNASMTAFKSLPTSQRQQAKSALLQSLPGMIQQRAASQAQLQNSLGVQMQMANAMAALGGQSSSLGDALSASTNASAQNMPASIQPLMQWEAAQQAAYGRQVQNAFTGASLAQPILEQYRQQVQQGQQLANTQYRTATAAGSGGGSQSLSGLLGQ